MKIFGANWKTTVSMAGGTIMGAIAFLASMSYDQGPIALVVPPEYKPKVTLIAGCCALFLWFWNGIVQKSKEVTGGSVQQTISGAKAAEGTQSMVDQTLVATKASGESITEDQQDILSQLPKNNKPNTP